MFGIELQTVVLWSWVQEPDAVVSILGEMDAWIICPFFLQGGRYTIEDIHYVADSDMYVLPFNLSYEVCWFYFTI